MPCRQRRTAGLLIAVLVNAAPAPFVTTVNIVGGTKQFASASGQYVATGELDFVTGAAVGTFTADVCKESSRGR